MLYTELLNTLQQDLFLVAKYHYKTELSPVEAARLVCAHHILHNPKHMHFDSVVHWIMKEFVDTQIILPTREKLTRFIVRPNSVAFSKFEPWPTSSDEYFQRLAASLLSELSRTESRRDDVNLMPFDIPMPDPLIVAMLNEPLPEKDDAATV